MQLIPVSGFCEDGRLFEGKFIFCNDNLRVDFTFHAALSQLEKNLTATTASHNYEQMMPAADASGVLCWCDTGHSKIHFLDFKIYLQHSTEPKWCGLMTFQQSVNCCYGIVF